MTQAAPQLRSPLRELEPEHTAVMLHWPSGIKPDLTVIVEGVRRGESLHEWVDALLEEHVPATDGTCEVVTEVSIFWHHANGWWETTEFVSHYYS